eukprot:SM001933S04892  [mRNA]  locus=s1933:313:1859:- [translate_table: standard]
MRALLSARQYRVPDVEGARAARCQLASFRAARRLRDKDCNVYLALLFHAVAMLMAAAGLLLSLSRFDLFHGHLFVTDSGGKGPRNGPCCRLGILFHAMEYPAFCPNTFPINLGYCQHGSTLEIGRSFDFRNILWLAPAAPHCAAVLVALDASHGTPVYDGLVGEDLGLVRTIFEGASSSPTRHQLLCVSVHPPAPPTHFRVLNWHPSYQEQVVPYATSGRLCPLSSPFYDKPFIELRQLRPASLELQT